MSILTVDVLAVLCCCPMQILPYSPLASGSPEKCAERTGEACEDAIGSGCRYNPPGPDPAQAKEDDAAGEGTTIKSDDCEDR